MHRGSVRMADFVPRRLPRQELGVRSPYRRSWRSRYGQRRGLAQGGILQKVVGTLAMVKGGGGVGVRRESERLKAASSLN